MAGIFTYPKNMSFHEARPLVEALLWEIDNDHERNLNKRESEALNVIAVALDRYQRVLEAVES